VRTALTLAAERGSKGEVALLVGLALQGQEPASADAETIAIAVRALRRVGLSTQAVDLTREYLLALDMAVPTRAAAASTPAVNAIAAKPNLASAAQPNQPKLEPLLRALPTAPAPKAKAASKPSWTPPK
jgi:ATP phosphoribosyltransferase regulatory subunit HisZ